MAGPSGHDSCQWQPSGADLTEYTIYLYIINGTISSVKSTDKKIHLYRLFPIYTEERDLEVVDGLPALMEAFDRSGASLIVDLKRQNAADVRKSNDRDQI